MMRDYWRVAMAILAIISFTESTIADIVEEIRAAYHIANSAVDSIDYSADCCGRTFLTPAGEVRKWHMHIALKGSHRFAEIGHYWGSLDWRDDPRLCQTFVNGNGLEEYWVNKRLHHKFKSIPVSRIPSFDRLKTEFILECTGIWPDRCKIGTETNASSILSVIDGYKDWMIEESVYGGIACVNLRNKKHSLLFSKVHNYALMRRLSEFDDSSELVVMYHNQNFHLASQGVWIPFHLQRIIFRGGWQSNHFSDIAIPEANVLSSTEQIVTSATLNDVSDSLFEPRLLPGSLCNDQRKNTTHAMPGGTDLLIKIINDCRGLTDSRRIQVRLFRISCEVLRVVSQGLAGGLFALTILVFLSKRRSRET